MVETFSRDLVSISRQIAFETVLKLFDDHFELKTQRNQVTIPVFGIFAGNMLVGEFVT